MYILQVGASIYNLNSSSSSLGRLHEGLLALTTRLNKLLPHVALQLLHPLSTSIHTIFNMVMMRGTKLAPLSQDPGPPGSSVYVFFFLFFLSSFFSSSFFSSFFFLLFFISGLNDIPLNIPLNNIPLNIPLNIHMGNLVHWVYIFLGCAETGVLLQLI